MYINIYDNICIQYMYYVNQPLVFDDSLIVLIFIVSFFLSLGTRGGTCPTAGILMIGLIRLGEIVKSSFVQKFRTPKKW